MNKVYVIILDGKVIKATTIDPVSDRSREIVLTDVPTNPIGKVSCFRVKSTQSTNLETCIIVEYDVELTALQG